MITEDVSTQSAGPIKRHFIQILFPSPDKTLVEEKNERQICTLFFTPKREVNLYLINIKLLDSAIPREQICPQHPLSIKHICYVCCNPPECDINDYSSMSAINIIRTCHKNQIYLQNQYSISCITGFLRWNFFSPPLISNHWYLKVFVYLTYLWSHHKILWCFKLTFITLSNKRSLTKHPLVHCLCTLNTKPDFVLQLKKIHPCSCKVDLLSIFLNKCIH